MPHPLHRVIGDLFEETIVSPFTLVKDPACGGNQNIPMFCSSQKPNATELCNVDLLVLGDGAIRVIVEIDESDTKPTQIAGKFLTSALVSHFIHDRHGTEAIPKRTEVLFIQIADTSGLPMGTSKVKQWKNIERCIQEIIPLGKITEYRLLHGDKNDFLAGPCRQHLIDILQSAYR